MKISSLLVEDRKEVATEAAEAIKNGGVVLFPTDTLYGLGVCL